ncbi:type II toxin-antitoxin system PemK/MazF family toxin [Bifidobacterium simiarum]|nr:type II toxin-antitoxin system PemK/MazF family toxin [Bifidobacterium simiarum]
MNEPRPYEVWLMWVEYPDHPGVGKVRPVVVVKVADDVASGVVAKVTSVTTWDEAGDVPLLDWREAGLLKPSMVRCGQRFEFAVSDLKRRFGMLSVRDAANVAVGLDLTKHVTPYRRR